MFPLQSRGIPCEAGISIRLIYWWEDTPKGVFPCKAGEFPAKQGQVLIGNLLIGDLLIENMSVNRKCFKSICVADK